MVKLYSKQELSHLKWKLINKDGLSVLEAEKRIDGMLAWTQSQHKKTIAEKKARKKAKTPKDKFKEGIAKLSE